MNMQIILQGAFLISLGITSSLIAPWLMKNAAEQGEYCGTPEGNILVGGFLMFLVGSAIALIGGIL